MNRLDRALGILLALRGGATISAAALAARFEVSPRTIYRDVEALAAVGVPVYAELGRAGGFRLAEGYFLPPIMFAPHEAVALLLGLIALRSLSAGPFAAEREAGAAKLLAALPERLRATLAEAQKVIGFEQTPVDTFHHDVAPEDAAAAPAAGDVSAIVSDFLRALLDHRGVELDYHSPYAAAPAHITAAPRGLVWDRERWYLVGQRIGQGTALRLWRADRVQALGMGASLPAPASDFDVRSLLGRQWLSAAMRRWAAESPVRIRLTPQQATRLQHDWYYRHAAFAPCADGGVLMQFGDTSRSAVFELLRWLGPGAELLEPQAWRAELYAELRAMAGVYEEG